MISRIRSIIRSAQDEIIQVGENLGDVRQPQISQVIERAAQHIKGMARAAERIPTLWRSSGVQPISRKAQFVMLNEASLRMGENSAIFDIIALRQTALNPTQRFFLMNKLVAGGASPKTAFDLVSRDSYVARLRESIARELKKDGLSSVAAETLAKPKAELQWIQMMKETKSQITPTFVDVMPDSKIAANAYGEMFAKILSGNEVSEITQRLSQELGSELRDHWNMTIEQVQKHFEAFASPEQIALELHLRSAAKGRGEVQIFDHHGMTDIGDGLDSTQKILRDYERKLIANGMDVDATVQEIKANGSQITTNNLGDGIDAMEAIENPREVLEEIKRAGGAELTERWQSTHVEDFTLFSTEPFQYPKATRAQKVAASRLHAFDQIIAKYPDAFVPGTDRLKPETPLETQMIIMEEAKNAVREARANPEIHAEAFFKEISRGVETVRHARLAGLSNEQIAFVEMSKVAPAKLGRFAGWAAAAKAHDVPVQVTVTEFPGGKKLYFAAIPYGKKLSSGKDMLSVVETLNDLHQARGGTGKPFNARANVVFGVTELSPENIHEVLTHPQNGLFVSPRMPKAIPTESLPVAATSGGAKSPFSRPVEQDAVIRGLSDEGAMPVRRSNGVVRKGYTVVRAEPPVSRTNMTGIPVASLAAEMGLNAAVMVVPQLLIDGAQLMTGKELSSGTKTAIHGVGFAGALVAGYKLSKTALLPFLSKTLQGTPAALGAFLGADIIVNGFYNEVGVKNHYARMLTTAVVGTLMTQHPVSRAFGIGVAIGEYGVNEYMGKKLLGHNLKEENVIEDAVEIWGYLRKNPVDTSENIFKAMFIDSDPGEGWDPGIYFKIAKTIYWEAPKDLVTWEVKKIAQGGKWAGRKAAGLAGKAVNLGKNMVGSLAGTNSKTIFFEEAIYDLQETARIANQLQTFRAQENRNLESQKLAENNDSATLVVEKMKEMNTERPEDLMAALTSIPGVSMGAVRQRVDENFRNEGFDVAIPGRNDRGPIIIHWTVGEEPAVERLPQFYDLRGQGFSL